MNLCVLSEVVENNVRKIETYNFDLSEKINGKDSWESSNGYQIYWYTGTTNQWVLSGIENTFIFSYTTNEIPFSGWQILGSRPPKQIKNLRITTGDCENNVLVDYNVNIKKSSCKCDGALIIDTYSGIPPFNYFLNNKKQPENIIENLCEGKYVINVEDNNGSSTIKEVTIPKNNITEYFVTLNFNKTNGFFELTCSPNLTENINIKFDLVYQNVLTYAPLFNSYTQNTSEQININGTQINDFPNFSEVIQTTNLQRPCIGSTYKVVKTKEWKGITLNSGDTFNGFINSDLILNVDNTTFCLNGNQNLTLSLKNLQILNCDCCNVTKTIINK